MAGMLHEEVTRVSAWQLLVLIVAVLIVHVTILRPLRINNIAPPLA